MCSMSMYVKLESRGSTCSATGMLSRSFGNLMLIDDIVMVTGFDNFIYHEIMSHPILFTHPDPKEVVVIGGGDCGVLQQVLLHKGVKRARQIEIDRRVTELAEVYFPELCSSNADPRAAHRTP